MPNTHKIRVAVIGGGNMGKNHLRNYFLLPEAELVGLADINPAAKALAGEYKAQFFGDYKEMLDTLKPDAVSIVVPTPFHAEVASEVMNRGIHCLLEKPIASTVDEADALIDLAKKKKLVFTVGHIEHYNPVVRKLKQLMKTNKLGSVTSIVTRRVGGFPAIEPKTDVIIDLAVHDIGIISFLLERQPKKNSQPRFAYASFCSDRLSRDFDGLRKCFGLHPGELAYTGKDSNHCYYRLEGFCRGQLHYAGTGVLRTQHEEKQ